MRVDEKVIDAAARLIQGELDNGLPWQDEADWANLDERQAATLRDLLYDVSTADLADMLRLVARRLPEPEVST